MRSLLAALTIAGLIFFAPPSWTPQALTKLQARLVGPPAYVSPPTSIELQDIASEEACPEDLPGWRRNQSIEGVRIRGYDGCLADNPYAVAAFVKGSNHVSANTLSKSGLAPDAVEKGRDLDGDGDPDEIHIRLEVAELNGGSPELQTPTTQFSIAPGIKPGLWVFAPKTLGMSTENFVSLKARALLRLPAPVIRVEQGDHVQITLENSHHMPHTIHFHGVDHPFLDAAGEGNDGVPLTSELPVMPGSARTYDLTPRHPGTMLYHCHVQPQVHMMMGLQGMFVVEENRPDNWLQTLNIGAGQVRVPSVSVRENYDREYDLHYQDVDIDLNNIIQQHNDVRILTEQMHRRFNTTNAISEFHTLNGRSFPYTFRESLIITEPNEHLKLRILNGGSHGIALHTHGHKATITHLDGVVAPEGSRVTRDVFWIATAQRLDVDLNTTNDGLHSYGPGVWLLHDHEKKGVTNDGIGPGGNISAIVYGSFLEKNGWPRTFGESLKPFFSEAYYERRIPIWQSYAQDVFGEAGSSSAGQWRVAGFWFFLGLACVQLVSLGMKFRKKSES